MKQYRIYRFDVLQGYVNAYDETMACNRWAASHGGFASELTARKVVYSFAA